MSKKIQAIKEYIKTFFDEEGRALAATQISGKEVNFGEIFKEGEVITVRGISKGKGFAGVVKRWGFKGRQSVSHGTKHELRTPGSTGSSQPDRVRKGKKLAGRMGADRVTVRNLKIAKIDKEKNLLFVRGAVPGHRGTFLEIRG